MRESHERDLIDLDSSFKRVGTGTANQSTTGDGGPAEDAGFDPR